MIWPIPDSKVHGANMGPIWGRQDTGGPHVAHMNLAIWDMMKWTGISKVTRNKAWKDFIIF